ncbi:MAG: hypothetical protein II864_07015 [Prevotella sp.]|nr:hypothetical protein [Prevotella sp.]
MDNPIDSQREVFELGLDTELLNLAVLEDEWLDPAEKLTVYKEAAMLMSEICTVTKQFDKADRSFSEELRLLGLKLLSLIYVSNYTRDDSANMRKALKVEIFMRMLCRICVHQRVMSRKHYAMFAPRFDNIGRQLSGWIRMAERKKDNNKQ